MKSAVYVHVHSLGIPAQGSWKLLDELEDPELKVLASKLPNTVLHSQADSTVKKYLGGIQRMEDMGSYTPSRANPCQAAPVGTISSTPS